RDDLLVAEDLGRVLAERMHVLARGEAGPDQPLGTLALREVVGGVDGVEARDALRLDVGDERVGDVGEDHAARHVDVVGLDELAEPRQRGGRDAFVVLEDDVQLTAGDLPAALLPEQLAAAVHVLAGLGDGPGQRREKADLDRAAFCGTIAAFAGGLHGPSTMALLTPLTRDEVAPDLVSLWDECERVYPDFRHLWATMAHSPIVIRHVWGQLLDLKRESPVD